jgi:predicted PurR-regulated permease PerM
MADDEIQVEAVAEVSAPTEVRGGPPRFGHWAMNFIGIGTILLLCYYGELVLAVMLISVLVAFILAPVVDVLQFFRLPRGVAAFVAVLLLVAAIGGIFYFSYNQAAAFVHELPKYAGKVREEIMSFRKSAEDWAALNPEPEKDVVKIRPATDWTDILTRGFGSVGTAVLVGSFVPFLAYFMLTWQEHVRSATVMLFPLQNRHTAYVTLGLISAMIRSFMVGNFLIGVIVGLVSTAVFGLIHLPFFYFAGFISGFLSLVPYLGVLLALVPPIFVGLGHLELQDVLIIFVTVLSIHLIAMNVLYPKFLGSRLQLNPLAVTMGLLVWGALWGGIGLVLAIPITAAMKIVFDHVDSLRPYGTWLGE